MKTSQLVEVLDQIRKIPRCALPDVVENCDGVAVFKRNGHVVGWMNWNDFERAIEETKATIAADVGEGSE